MLYASTLYEIGYGPTAYGFKIIGYGLWLYEIWYGLWLMAILNGDGSADGLAGL